MKFTHGPLTDECSVEGAFPAAAGAPEPFSVCNAGRIIGLRACLNVVNTGPMPPEPWDSCTESAGFGGMCPGDKINEDPEVNVNTRWDDFKDEVASTATLSASRLDKVLNNEPDLDVQAAYMLPLSVPWCVSWAASYTADVSAYRTPDLQRPGTKQGSKLEAETWFSKEKCAGPDESEVQGSATQDGVMPCSRPNWKETGEKKGDLEAIAPGGKPFEFHEWPK